MQKNIEFSLHDINGYYFILITNKNDNSQKEIQYNSVESMQKAIKNYKNGSLKL